MATLFADISTPFVNDITLRRILSPTVKENIFQGIMLKPGEAVTEQYSEDTDAAEIQVLRLKPLPNDAREIGATTNGAWFNSEAPQTSSTEAYGIQILQTIDRVIDIPTNAQDMVSINLASGEAQNLAGLVNRNINAVSLSAMIAKNFNNIAGFDQKNSNAAAKTITAVDSNWVTKASNGTYMDCIIDAGAHLDDGNSDQGIDAYPDDQRAVIIRPSVKADVLKGMIALNGGTGVFDVLRRGGADTETRPKVATTGYLGELNNMPVYCASNVVWALVEKYLGMTAGALDKMVGIVCSGIGTGRALAFNSRIKDIPSPNGQGIRLQPKYRFGCECWDPLSVVPIFSETFTNPVTAKTNTLYVRGSASRT